MPHRRLILNLLEHYKPESVHEEEALMACLDFVNTHSDCFLRSNLGGHITASCWLLSPDESHVLLTHHKKIGQWLQLGGHADGDEDILRVALKEAEEESGIEGIKALKPDVFDLDIHPIATHHDVPAHLHYDLRFVLKAPSLDYQVSNESHALKWCHILELAEQGSANASIGRMARKWLDGKKNKKY